MGNALWTFGISPLTHKSVDSNSDLGHIMVIWLTYFRSAKLWIPVSFLFTLLFLNHVIQYLTSSWYIYQYQDYVLYILYFAIYHISSKSENSFGFLDSYEWKKRVYTGKWAFFYISFPKWSYWIDEFSYKVVQDTIFFNPDHIISLMLFSFTLQKHSQTIQNGIWKVLETSVTSYVTVVAKNLILTSLLK